MGGARQEQVQLWWGIVHRTRVKPPRLGQGLGEGVRAWLPKACGLLQGEGPST